VAMRKMIVLCVGGLLLWTALCRAQPIPEGNTYPGPLPAAWGMTLTQMPSAQISTWLSEWGQNIIGNCTGPDGYSYRMFGSNTYGTGEDLAWVLTPSAEGLYYGYMATGDATYVSLFVGCVDQLVARAVIEPDGYPGWPAPGASGTGGGGWPVADTLASYNADSMLGEAYVFRPIALMAYQMINNPQLQAQYAAKGQSYLTLAETIYAKWMARGGWQPTTVNGVSGEVSVYVPQGLSADYTTWVTYSTNPMAGAMSHQCNKANAVARWMLAMYDVTGGSQYLTHAQKWFTLMKSRMSASTDSYAVVDLYGNVIWNYWEPAGPWDYTSGAPNFWIGLHPNDGYYAVDTTAIVEAYEHGVVFTKADMASLVHIVESDWTTSEGDGGAQWDFDPTFLQAGMSISVTPASGTATYLCACFPNSLTASASVAWPDANWWLGDSSLGTGALNGTIVSTTFDETTGTGTTVVQPNGGGSHVTFTTNTNTVLLSLRQWPGTAPYASLIQTFFVGSQSAYNIQNGWGELSTIPWWLMLQSELTLGTSGVQVTLAPQGAIDAGAQWNVDGGAWLNSGATVTGLSAGSHDVYFNSVPGWASPVSTPITVTAGTRTFLTGTYTQLAGSLTVALNPAAALAAGAQWNVGGGWQNGGANIGGLTVGSGYTVNYNTIAGWASPATTPVTISSNTATTAIANYLQTAGAPFMTLQPLPLATWQEWFGLWDSNIEGEYSWEMTPGVLVTGFSDYGGLGENVDWQLAPVLTGFYYGYMASSDTHYVDLMVSCVDTLIGLETIEPDGYPGWPAYGAGGTGTDDLNWYYADSMLADAAAFRPIVLMAYQMITNPALKATYGAKGQTYLALAETLYQKWVQRGGWRDTTYPGGMISVDLPEGMDPATGYTTWITNPATNWADSPGQNSYTSANEYGPTWIAQGINNGMSHPTNKADEVALWLLAMWDATGNPEYKLRASKWFTYLKNYRMTLQDEWTSGLDGAGDLIWNYWEPAGSWDFSANQAQNLLYGGWGIGDTKTWVGTHPNNGYYWIDTQCIVAAFEHGVVFNEADITTLITDAKTSWTPSSGLGTTQYYFNPSSLLPGMSVSAYPASGTVQQVAGCIPNSLTSAASTVWPSVVAWNGGSYPGVLNGTIVSVTWNGSTGTIVVQPNSGGANVTLNTNTNSEVWLLRMWNNFVPYDTQIQQQFESNEDTNPATANSWGGADDSYFLWLHSTLTVQSTPTTGINIVSTLGEGYPTNYTIPGAECPTNINLQAPATDPAGFTFLQWMVNGTAQTPGLKTISFAKTEPTTAVAQYIPNYTLNVQSTPPLGVSISSSTSHGGTTNYTVTNVLQGTSVNLQVPATDPTGYSFSQWTVNGEAQTPGQKAITLTMTTDTTAVAQYTLNGYVLTVKSTPPTGLNISSSTSHNGTTNYTIAGIDPGTSVNLQAPAADPGGLFTFSQWTLNGVAQTPGVQSITFTPTASTTAVAQYTANTGTLAVQSTDSVGNALPGLSITGTYPGTTNYGVGGIALGTGISLQAPAADPAGYYTFSHWTLNGVAQTAGVQTLAFTMTTGTVAVAQYTQKTYTLNIQSTPATGIGIGSSTGHNGVTNYTIAGVGAGTSVNLAAPWADPTGYAFLQWTVNGTAQTSGRKSITFTMTAATTAVAQYAPTLTVESQNPASGVAISISPTDNNDLAGGITGTPPITRTYNPGTSVTLTAPSSASGNNFLEWLKNGNDYSANPTITVTAANDIYTAVYLTSSARYVLAVQSTPPPGLHISSSTGHGGVTNYSIPAISNDTYVDLTAPATDPAGYIFLRWTVNGAAQPPGQKYITFTMDAVVTAIAQYTTITSYTLMVKSTPPTWLNIGSSTGQYGATPYMESGVAYGASVNLQAPATDPTGYTFSLWTVNGTAQAAGQKSVTFMMDVAVTAVAKYNAGYTLTVESSPVIGNVITSSTSHGGTTNYTVPGIAYGASVNLQAPATDPAGYTFLQWTVNGAPLAAGQKAITFTMEAASMAVAQYTANVGYTLTVQSTPPGALGIGSSTGQSGTTNYTKTGIAYGASVNLQAPATDPAGYTFLQWTLNGAAQIPGQKSITFTTEGAATAVARYTTNIGYTLTVQSTPTTGLSIGSSTGQSGTTNYTAAGVGEGTSVNLQAPATDPTGYTFSQWTVNGAAQIAGQKSITFTMDGAVTAVAQYTLTGYALTVESTPPTGLSIGSSTGQKGTTNYYTNTGVADGTSVNLQAPATDPAGYTFSQWLVNGAPQTARLKSITFTMSGATTAVAQYTLNGYTLSVQSTPPGKLVISSNTGQYGTTNYTVPGIAYGASVNLQAPATDPAGYAFLQWTLNGAAQAPGQKSITFTMDVTVTAVAQYTTNTGYTLTVQSTPPTALSIGSSTAQSGTTSYTKSGVVYGTSVNLQAPATDPAGYIFSQWTVNGTTRTPGQKSVTFAMDGAVTAVAHYTTYAGCTLTVQSTPPTALGISSSTGQSGTTSYTKAWVAYGTSVCLQAPATAPAGYAFLQWTVNGTAQPPGQKSVTCTMNGAVTAVAQYTLTGYALTVQSTPTGVKIGSSTGHNGTSSYTVSSVAYGTSVNLQAPATDPAGYTFSEWTVDGTIQTLGQKSITFTMDGAVTAVAQYTKNTVYTLSVQSMPMVGLVINSTTGHKGTTNYTKSGLTYGTSVCLQAPATDPAGYTFAHWTVNGAAQPAYQKSVMFTITAATTAVAQYVPIIYYKLTVQSTPPTGLIITSSSAHGGTTNYTVASVAQATSVNLAAPATDPAGYTFSQWSVNGTAQTPGLKSITFAIAAATTAVAQYVPDYVLTVRSTPPTGLSISSTTGHGGATNYSVASVPQGTSVNLSAPATDPAGYAFSQWSVNGTAQTAGQKSITFSMAAATTAVAQYVPAYLLTVQSTPPTGMSIGSDTGHSGTTNYTVAAVIQGTSVNIGVPAQDPTGWAFSQWTVNGTPQTAGERSIVFTMTAATTAIAQYVPTYTLSVQSTPPTGLYITSTGDWGLTNYTVGNVAQGTSVNLAVPATDPTGYTFSQWSVNGTAQTAGLRSITFTVEGATTAVAQYTLDVYTLTVQSTPPTGLVISSSTADGGTTTYTVPGIVYGTSVNLQAPATDSTGVYTFSEWTLNGAPQAVGQSSITFTMTGGTTTAVAQYTTYTLNVQSTPPTGLSIGSSTGEGGTTSYSVLGMTSGGSSNLQAPATDPTGYTFSQWMVNGVAQTAGQKSVTFAAPATDATWGSYGSTGNGLFNGPEGIAIDSAGNVYVVDTGNNLVQKFTSAGTFVTQWGGAGSGNGQFNKPVGIALDSTGNVYVADMDNNRIQVFTSGGTFVTKWGGTFGSQNGLFEWPRGIAVNGGNVYVADTNNHRIQVFTSAGTYVTQWGSQGSGNGQFDYPSGITFDSAGNVYVADTLNCRIQKFTSAGVYVTQWGGHSGSGNEQFEAPFGIALDSAGNVYVTDADLNRIQEFTSAGAYITQWSSGGSGIGQLNAPTGIALDSNGNVYVADTSNNRIQVFRLNILAVAQYVLNP